jgi:hypothetical protein
MGLKLNKVSVEKQTLVMGFKGLDTKTNQLAVNLTQSVQFSSAREAEKRWRYN